MTSLPFPEAPLASFSCTWMWHYESKFSVCLLASHLFNLIGNRGVFVLDTVSHYKLMFYIFNTLIRGDWPVQTLLPNQVPQALYTLVLCWFKHFCILSVIIVTRVVALWLSWNLIFWTYVLVYEGNTHR